MKTPLLTALLLTATTVHAQTSIVVNGSFEEPKVNGPWAAFPTMTGWRTVSGPGSELQTAGVGWRPLAGAQMLELDWTAPRDGRLVRWSTPSAAHADMVAAHRNSVPSIHIRWRITAILRAKATLARLIPWR